MSRTSKFWDNSADNYDRTEARFESIHERSRQLARSYLSGDELALDYGCGTGTTTVEMAGHVREIYAIDISQRMIEISKEKATDAGLSNVVFRQGDIWTDQYASDSFNVILAFNMLHTIPDPDRVILRIYDLLKPGGLLLSVTPCLAAKMSFVVRLQILLVRLLGTLRIVPIPIRRLRSSDLDTLISSAHLSIVGAEELFAGASSYFVAARK